MKFQYLKYYINNLSKYKTFFLCHENKKINNWIYTNFSTILFSIYTKTLNIIFENSFLLCDVNIFQLLHLANVVGS